MATATNDDALREFAWNAGMEQEDREWLLHEWDVWVRNPHYTGEPGPHPEDDDDNGGDASLQEPFDPFDDIPF